jgi:protein arginine kinase
MISSMECLELISALRLGLELKILQSIERKTLNHLMVIIQPAHIQKQRKKKLSEIERDSVRAELIKEKLHLN